MVQGHGDRSKWDPDVWLALKMVGWSPHQEWAVHVKKREEDGGLV